MLKKELNDLVTQTGPGTAMGNMFRRYWLPALLSEQLPGPDCEPVRLELLSEKMLDDLSEYIEEIQKKYESA